MNIFPEAGMYIHVPFCISKCKYCDFYSLTNKEELIPEYVKRLKNALEYYRNRYARRYNSLYFGGGTPLLLGEEHLCDIMASAVPLLSKRAEVTAEGNPAAGGKIDFGVPFKAVYSADVTSWEAADCPLCKAGELELVKPGSRKIK